VRARTPRLSFIAVRDSFPVGLWSLSSDGPDQGRNATRAVTAGATTTLVLAHAAGFHGACFSPLAQHLDGLARRHSGDRLPFSVRALAIDFRGHGHSPAPRDGNFSWQRLGEDLLDVIDVLGLTRPFGVGHSLGGTALLLAEEERPGTFSELYCYEPIVFNPAHNPKEQILAGRALAARARRRREIFSSTAAAYSHYRSRPPLDVLSEEVLSAYVHDGFTELHDTTVRLACRGESEASIYEAATSHSAWERLDRVACPVTLAFGGRSDAIGAAATAELAARLGDARVEVYETLGHFGPLESPELVAGALGSRLSRSRALPFFARR